VDGHLVVERDDAEILTFQFRNLAPEPISVRFLSFNSKWPSTTLVHISFVKYGRFGSTRFSK